MRKHQQRQILELIETMEEAQSAGLYADCECGAVSICGFIEAAEVEGPQTIALLEEYCELLGKANKGEIKEKQLRKHLIKIKNSVMLELKPNKIEVAFFPYKASMADSFESIYLSAKADPHCDAYWIPIPFFERTENGTLGKMFYEGAQYPDYFEVIDWRSYNVEVRKPDIIFIHNPYDEFNFVTSVHPNYYSKALKKHTDFLVYVDYGIPFWVPHNPSLSIQPDKVTVLPYQIHCDLIISYSVEYAEYVKYALLLLDQVKRLFNKKQLNKKIVALGSAKFDKVLNSKKEDYTLPDAWQKTIGSKKVLLYSTSLSELLKDGEKNLDQMVSIIESLSKRDDIVLWWRPHPLTSSMIGSMRPELAEKYLTIIDNYKCCNIGIFDDTANVHRAIAHSDGCLTNYSSLMFLYLASGKPFTVLAESIKLPPLTAEHITDFRQPLLQRIYNMKTSKGANRHHLNTCIWWNNFLPENILAKEKYDNWLDMFIDYIVSMGDYSEAEEYQQLQLQMFRDFVVNPDGTAGGKIYQYCKERINE